MRFLLALFVAVSYVACDTECADLPSCNSFGYCSWGCGISPPCCVKEDGIWKKSVLRCFCGDEDTSSSSDSATTEN